MFTPYTLDTYGTFNFDGTDELILENAKEDNGGVEVSYDDFDWKYDTNGYLLALRQNLLKLLNANILDDVILKVEPEGDIVRPREYNFSTDWSNLVFTVNENALNAYIEAHKEAYDAEHLRDRDGFWWFGDELQTRLNWYLSTVSEKTYTQEEYIGDQMEGVSDYEYVTATKIAK